MATDREIIDEMSEGRTVYCGKCLEACAVEGRDYGVGHYGYGAGFGSHSDVCLESACCDSEDLLLEHELPEPEDDGGVTGGPSHASLDEVTGAGKGEVDA